MTYAFPVAQFRLPRIVASASVTQYKPRIIDSTAKRSMWSLVQNTGGLTQSIYIESSKMVATMRITDAGLVTKDKATPLPAIYEDDPEIAVMSKVELIAEVEALFGVWVEREDITDDWLTEIREGWDERLADIYGPTPEDQPS